MATAELTVDVVAVAAEAREFAGLRRRAEECTAVAGWKIGQAWVAQAGGLRWLLTANGPGGRLAGLATAEALRQARTPIVVSVGLCGALDDRFEAGTVVQAGEVMDGRGRRWAAGRVQGGAPVVRVLSLDRVAVSRAEKRKLGAESGAGIIEMEAAAVAGCAAEAGVPFYCLKAVSDGGDEELPMDFNRYRDGEGRFSRVRIGAACALRPWLAPALLSFDRQCRRSIDLLGEYIVDARFD
jgi:adenosylhomocysteine nucleosidase